MAIDLKDNIDFGQGEIRKLFRSIFIPTLFGMIFNIAFILTDGIFVGHGIGPRGLASVNLVAPVMMCLTGIGMMFGIGSSVMAAIHLSRRQIEEARLIMTQGLLGATLLSIVIVVLLYLFPDEVLRLLGTSEELLESSREYLYWFVPTCLFLMIEMVGVFSIRLDGSPKYAMYCAIVPAVLNILLDYVFIFPCGMALKGAALATDIGTAVGALMAVYYFVGPAKELRLYRLTFDVQEINQFWRHTGRMMKIGFSGFIGEFALSMMMLCGNRAFGKYMGDDGVSAYSVVCYLFPVVYNIFYAVSTSAQPIISYNHGARQYERVERTFRYSVRISLLFAGVTMLIMCLLPASIVSVFIDGESESFRIASEGLPYYATGFMLTGYNVSAIGYFQSIENNRASTLLMSLRGLLLPIVMFILLPMIVGVIGLWLAIPATELITLLIGRFFIRRTRTVTVSGSNRQ